MKLIKTKIDNVFWLIRGKKYLVTKNLSPGFSVYGEKLFRYKGKEYRQWIPQRSKLAAAIYKKFEPIPLKEGYKVLYLGAASGTTMSHVSDIVGKSGKVWGVDIAPRVLRDLIFVCERKKNMYPILADASLPETYSNIVPKVDFIYEDVAAPNQIDIFIKNCDMYLKKGKYAMIAIKARSIDVTSPPKEIFERAKKEIGEFYNIINSKRLEPYHKDHIMILVKK